MNTSQTLKPQATMVTLRTIFQYVIISLNRLMSLRKNNRKENLTAKIVTQDNTTNEYTIFWYQIKSSMSCGTNGVVSGSRFNLSYRYKTGKSLCKRPVLAHRHAHPNRRTASSRKSLRY